VVTRTKEAYVLKVHGYQRVIGHSTKFNVKPKKEELNTRQPSIQLEMNVCLGYFGLLLILKGEILMNEVQRRILAAQQARKEAKAKVHKSTKELTSLKFNQTEKRIAEIDLKIERLTKEKENLLRKQNNRKEFLSR
jgi:hypothetical protein